jgi:hypothetical protein
VTEVDGVGFDVEGAVGCCARANIGIAINISDRVNAEMR